MFVNILKNKLNIFEIQMFKFYLKKIKKNEQTIKPNCLIIIYNYKIYFKINPNNSVKFSNFRFRSNEAEPNCFSMIYYFICIHSEQHKLI